MIGWKMCGFVADFENKTLFLSSSYKKMIFFHCLNIIETIRIIFVLIFFFYQKSRKEENASEVCAHLFYITFINYFLKFMLNFY